MSSSTNPKSGVPLLQALPVVSLSSPRGCTRNTRGHLCHSIQASQSLKVARGDNSLIVAVGQSEAVTVDADPVTQLSLYNHDGLVGRFIHHDPELATRIVTGGSEPYVWEPSFGVLFALTDAQRDGLDAGAITLATETEFSACAGEAAQ